MNLGDGVSVRTAAASAPIILRAEFVGGSTPTITYMFPATAQPKAAVDGVHLNGATVFSREQGDASSLMTGGPLEIGVVCILHETLRHASAALTGRENAKILLAPSSIREGDAGRLAALHRDYFEASRAVDTPHWKGLSRSPRRLALMRDQITSSLVHLLDAGHLKRDHMAHQLQTASMRRIDSLIDAHSGGLIGLRDLCDKSGLSLRTMESIIRGRMGMTAHSYFQRRRLVFARKELLDPSGNASVTSIALDHGFNHLGRFSLLYRLVYGEAPSQTLANARR